MARQRVQKLFDPKLNVKDYSWKVAKYLKHVKLNQLPGYEEGMYAESTAFYNCRERGIALTLKAWNDKRPTLVIVFGEHRNSDSIFIDFWTMKSAPFNMPVVEDFTDEAYERRMYVAFTPDDDMFVEAAFFVTSLVATWVHGDIKHVELPKELPAAVEVFA